MTSFLAVARNDLGRLLALRFRIISIGILIVGAVAAAVLLNPGTATIGSVAYVAPNGADVVSSPYLKTTRLDQAPPLSELVAGRYDAIVIADGRGGVDIRSIRGDDFKRALAAAIAHPTTLRLKITGQRRPGTNIIGFLTMFLLMQGMTMTVPFAEDRERGQLRRIATSPASVAGYLCAHGLLAFLLMAVPTMVTLAAAKLIVGADIGLALGDHLLLVSLLCALATSFALLVCACVSKSGPAAMAGTTVIVLTSVLAGSFQPLTGGGRVLDAVAAALPQSALLRLADGLGGGGGPGAALPDLAYLAGLVAVLALAAVAMTKRGCART